MFIRDWEKKEWGDILMDMYKKGLIGEKGFFIWSKNGDVKRWGWVEWLMICKWGMGGWRNCF